jgi:riboflavin biosynthesis pyrimidine reductase
VSVAAHRVDRLWPDPATDLDLDAAFADLSLPDPPSGRPLVGVNSVTSLDGRAQLAGRAEGIGDRADRRLMRLLRTAYDAVGSGAGTLRADDFYSLLPDDLAARRLAAGRPDQPLAVLVAGRGSVPTDRRWFGYRQSRLLIAGRGGEAGRQALPPGTERLIAPDPEPDPRWLLAELARRGIGSLLIEGGPHLNRAFLAAGCIDELYWTVGPRILANDGLPMIAPLETEPERPYEARLVSIHRSGDELFLRYRLR